MDYQIEQLAKNGYVKTLDSDFLDFEKDTDFAEDGAWAHARISVTWNENPDSVRYYSIVRVVRHGTEVAVWYSKQTARFHDILDETEKILRFVGDIVLGGAKWNAQ